jgi:hypothetical protein
MATVGHTVARDLTRPSRATIGCDQRRTWRTDDGRRMADDKIEISLDDLGEVPPAAPTRATVPAAAASTGKAAGGALPGLPAPLPFVAITADGEASGSGAALATRLGANGVVVGVVAGLVSGGVGVLLAEAINSAFFAGDDVLHDGVLALTVGLLLGFSVGAWPYLSSGATARGLRDGGIGAAVGAAAAGLAITAANAAYEVLTGGDDTSESTESFALWLAWALIGTLAGGGLGLVGGWRKAVNGALGGLIGGALGGLLYVQVAGVEEVQLGPQALAVVLTTTGVAVAIGVVEHVRREAWLHVVAGPLSGKEFILYREEVTLGSVAAADIVLTKDAEVLPLHATLVRRGGTTQVRAHPGAQVSVNGRAVSQAAVADGDALAIGRTEMRYAER